ncbi:MAG: FumA C-terminus/TtdB family hydratase beta subunit [Clostridia bacterium]|nr:FumA C-terminus/TtdB family hydratase beta subunit [Clostridia bacterium]MDE6758251.1 FumA C-terminus/TtdB family hydratase beta subunit [Clostridia bacterium]MDE7079015.1 FumA C-terminus/TtdB family hydratase beta subunit [Clostridia bacterium]
MSSVKYLSLPLTKESMRDLRVGDMVRLSGEMLVFRDAGHKRLYQSILDGEQAFEYKGETIYFMGPCPARGNEAIGSAGPTTSCRMDKYTPYMLDHGLSAQIGKGKRSQESIDAFKRNGCVYFSAIGGAGAIYSKCITKAEVLYFEDLGTEAVRRITVKDFPVVVAIDSLGEDIYSK